MKQDFNKIRTNALALRKMADNLLSSIGQLDTAPAATGNKLKRMNNKADLMTRVLSGTVKKK